MDGIYQIASFHPNYKFNLVNSNAPENYTNRSPYPMLHILREDSIENAIANYSNYKNISKKNIKLMNKIGLNNLKNLLMESLKN